MKRILLFCLLLLFIIPFFYKKKDSSNFNIQPSETVFLTGTATGDTIELELEEYIKGVVYAEMPATFDIEALKAQAVAARTYTKYKLSSGINLCDNPEHCQAWKGPDDSEGYNKIALAVNSTKGEILTYSGNAIQAFFHSSSGGKTESSENVWGKSIPYLISTDSPDEEKIMSTFFSEKEFTYKELQEKINAYFKKKIILTDKLKDKIKILSKTEGERVQEIKIENTILKGPEIRDILSLRSANFTVVLNANSIMFKVKGYGHGVGMSQWGAEVMAEAGKTYKEILYHYYPNTVLENTKYE